MKESPDYQFHTLPNGIRVVHKRVKATVAHLGIIIKAGARDESSDQFGLAHFIEHVIFKGTKRRKAFHVLSRIENIGGDLNAYTSKEETCVYASFLPRYYSRSSELFSDILLNSTFPTRELEKEKDVIKEEILSYYDSPGEQIFDDIEDQVFGSHPLGHPILGSVQSLEKFGKDDIQDFIRMNYAGPSIVIASVGDVPLSTIVRITEHYFSALPNGQHELRPPLPVHYAVQQQRKERNTYQAHCMVANLAPAIDDPLRLPMILLNNVLGGPGMNTRLNLGIREKYGFCYNIESHYTPYSDTGLFSVYFGVDNSFVEKTFDLVQKELKRLINNPLGAIQLHVAQRQLIGQLAISFESNLTEMLSMGKSLHVFGRIDSFGEIYRRIMNIKTSEVLEAANLVFKPEMLSTLVYTQQK